MEEYPKGVTLEEESEILCERFEKGVKDGFGALLILYSIRKHQKASSKEIKDDLSSTFPQSMEYNYTAFYRLLNQLKSEVNLIKEIYREKSKGADRIYYSVTPLGELVLQKVFVRYVKPLAQLNLESLSNIDKKMGAHLRETKFSRIK